MERIYETSVQTIVLVDDDEAVRRLVSRILEREGYRVISAASAAEGLEALDKCEGEADLLLTDVTLPGGIDGIELGRRALEACSDLKILCMSGYGESLEMDEDLARRASAAAYIGKPFAPGKLVSAVHDLIGASR